MKSAILVGLACLNAALLVALVLGASVPAAQAQMVAGSVPYLMMTGKVQSDFDAVYIVDLASQRLAILKLDKTKTPKRMMPVAVRELARDFGHGGNE